MSAFLGIDFFPPKSDQKRLRPISAKLVVTDAGRQASFKLSFFTKQISGDEHIAIVCHDVKVAQALAGALREAAVELEAAIVKASNPFGR